MKQKFTKTLRATTVQINILFVIAIMMLMAGCSQKTPPIAKDDVILATVGDRIITANEFKVSFETSFAPLRRGVSPRRTYLNYMVNELLLANEGYRRGLDKSHYVQSRLEQRRYQNLLESFYQKYVHGKINIPEEDIQKAVKKSTVKFQLLIWPTPSLEDAEKAFAEASQTDLNDYIDKQLAKQEVPIVDKKNFQTDWVDYLEFPPEIVEQIQHTELHRPSQPIPFGGGYAVLQVENLEMHGITEAQLMAGPQRRSVEERLYRIEADQLSRAVSDSILSPMNVRVDGHTFTQLLVPLYSWVQDTLPKARPLIDYIESADENSKEYLLKIKKLLNKSLVTFEGGSNSVADYLYYMNYYRKALNASSSFDAFRATLMTEIGSMVRNNTFVDVARHDGFEDSLSVQRDLYMWEKKWIYDAYRNQLGHDIKVTSEEMQNYFKNRWRELELADVDTTRFYKYENEVHGALYHEKYMSILENKLTSLQKKYPVWVNETVLDTLTLDESQKASNISFFLRKSFTGEAYAPTVDPQWISY